MNAMALDADGTLIDPFGGRDDLAQKKIRCVGDAVERFSEDALRMLRAVRFSAQLGFEMEPHTADAIAVCAPQAAHLSAERVRSEVEKNHPGPMAGTGRRPVLPGLLDRWLGKNRFSRI
jgi:tRNA nucleotidyltransferase (CCA-adding enzyme)